MLMGLRLHPDQGRSDPNIVRVKGIIEAESETGQGNPPWPADKHWTTFSVWDQVNNYLTLLWEDKVCGSLLYWKSQLSQTPDMILTSPKPKQTSTSTIKASITDLSTIKQKIWFFEPKILQPSNNLNLASNQITDYINQSNTLDALDPPWFDSCLYVRSTNQ